MSEDKQNKKKNAVIETVKEQTTDFVNDAKDALEIAKEKINEIISEENIEKVKQKTEVFSEIAKEKASEFGGEAMEHISDFAEEAKNDIEEIKQKSKSFIQRFFRK